ncbi:hypothetical protein ACDA63_08090 [Uliginosibacterium sp. sgz301328]|uniref:hypothetical protein n=1 Tax=Uliginosibacterium sp. sgz301328 TaxID=3243764 RepID=UPI00359DC205
MDQPIPFGEKRVIDGQERVHYYGYWVKTYEAPADSLAAKKKLIEALTRRLFNHVEHGINIPGSRLTEAREAYESEANPDMKRVKGAMLAGALFNRAADIFTKLVELQAAGVEIASDNALMRQCGGCLQEALNLGRTVLHRSGEEGIDELWGEPFKAFSIPIESFYESRYIKIAQAMRDIDSIADAVVANFARNPKFEGVGPVVRSYAEAARIKSETLRTDEHIFDIWATFAVAGEALRNFEYHIPESPSELELREAQHGRRVLRNAQHLISDIARARVPMPKSTAEFLERANFFGQSYACRAPSGDAVAVESGSQLARAH